MTMILEVYKIKFLLFDEANKPLQIFVPTENMLVFKNKNKENTTFGVQ